MGASFSNLAWCGSLLFLDLLFISIVLIGPVSTYLSDAENSEFREELRVMFGSLPKTVVTLFMAMSGGRNWVDLFNPLVRVHWSLGSVLILYIFFTVFFLTNIMTGIFCDTAIQSAQSNRDEAIQSHLDAEASAYLEIK